MELKKDALLQGGKYRIEKVLGKGGFGITYLAEQKGLNRKVAVKEFFMSEYCNREEDTSHVSVPSVGSREVVDKYRVKFVKEAQIIAELDHPHIVPIYDVFEENGTAYYVMKYIDGGSLSSLVKKGETMPHDEVLKYVRQVAYALRYCHDRNVAHLDVKPGNILIQDGSAVLIDFGISKHYNEDGDQTSSTPLGISKGYAPLEQYKRGGVSVFSPVTDIYSLGAVLYRLVTGQTPPDADEVNEDGLPAFPSDVPQYIQDAITAAMQPKKKDRPQNIDGFLALLVGPVVADDESEETELIDDESEKNEPAEDVTPKKDELAGKYTAGNSRDGNGNNKKKIWIYGIAASLAVAVIAVVGVLVGQNISAKLEQAEADQTQYLMLISSADSLSRAEATMPDAVALYDSAAVYEARYASTRFSDLFAEDAVVSSTRVQSQIDSISAVCQQEAEERVRRELAAAEQARLEKEQAEKERMEREREAQEQAERERLERERKAQEQAERERLERERKAQEQAERERLERELAEKKKHGIHYIDNVLYVYGIEYPMVYVSGGSFMMGSDNRKEGHRVALSSYRIGKYEVTQDLWEAVMGSNPSKDKGARKPVVKVSWEQCQTFIRRLNIHTGQNFKLPTEAQWEFAARGGNSSRGYKYSGSDDIDNVGWCNENSAEILHVVGLKSPNELGLYDMSGNVSEWCRDWSGPYSSSSQTDPEGPSTGYARVSRGGSVFDNHLPCLVDWRFEFFEKSASGHIGLRLCL